MSDFENGWLGPPTAYDRGIHHWFSFSADHVRSLTDDYLAATTLIMTDCSGDTFKRCLDKYISMVPDEPHISGYTALRRAESNSLFDMAQFASAHLVSTLEAPDQVSVARGGHPWSPWV